MIKINLASKKGSTVSDMASAGAKSSADIMGKLRGIKGLSSISELSPEAKAMAVAGVIYGAIIVGGYLFLETHKTNLLDEAQARVTENQSKLTLLDSEIAKTAGYETLKKDLENDEKLMRTKIDTIQQLVDERTVTPQILITLSKVTPKDVWISNFSMKENTKIEIDGLSFGLSVISDFMKALEETIYFKDVNLKGSKQSKEQGREVATFGLEASRR